MGRERESCCGPPPASREGGGGVAGRKREVGEERWREKEKGDADMWGPPADMWGPPPYQQNHPKNQPRG